jgi:hypothetical protein
LQGVIENHLNFGYAGPARSLVPKQLLRSIVIYLRAFDTSTIEFPAKPFFKTLSLWGMVYEAFYFVANEFG